MRKQELHPRTAVINKVQKIQSKKAKTEALHWLATTFPKAFDNTLCIQPLKNGIMDDILLHADKAAESGISRSKIREALVLFTRRIDYLTCLKAREMRIDLDGNSITAVTEEEAERAAVKIKKRVDKSVRNARKLLVGKPPAHYIVKPQNARATTNSHHSQSPNEFNPHYVERPPMFSSQNALIPPAKASQVIVKHKTVRQFDPDAVARLKEKLGLSRKVEETKE